MEFEKGQLYISNDKECEGCVFEYIGYNESMGWYEFKAIIGNSYWIKGESPYAFDEKDVKAFKPLIPTHEEVERVNHPSHYNQGIEAIEYIESHNMDFNEGNVIKYLTRAKHKGTYLEDLKKARWYLDRLIQKGESND
jgi:hypothetical protein